MLAAILFTAGCKKDEGQQPTANCPDNNTFINNISQYVGEAEVVSIQEGGDGSIHVEVSDNGAWSVHAFTAEGVHTSSVNLGTYTFPKTLKVQDAYYITNYTESYTTPSPADTFIIQFQGWVQVSGYIYSSSNNICTPAVDYSIYEHNTTFSPTHLATTTVQKIGFDGTTLWNKTFDGYYSTYLSKSPVVFDENGNLYLFTIDYKGAKMKAHINNNDYELDDPNRPNFYLTDTLLIKDDINSYIVTKLNTSNGNELWQKKNLFDKYYDNYSSTVNGIITSTNIWVCNSDGLYKLDLSGNFIEKVALLNGYCIGKGYNRVVREFANGDLFLSMGDYASGWLQYTDYRIDVNGNVIWQKTGNTYPSFAYLNFTANNDYLYSNSTYDNNGNLINTIPLVDMINANGGNFNCTTCGSTLNEISCNNDLLFIRANGYSGASSKTFLIRTNSNGDL
jgi:hypothetical protein